MRRKGLAAVLTVFLALMVACGGDVSSDPVSKTSSPESETPSPKKDIPVALAQTRKLMLRLESPETSLITDADQVIVSGVASPDATLSVNGVLTLPDDQGRFSISIKKPETENPLAIEVIASSLTGETKSLLRSVIFSGSQGYYGAYSGIEGSKINLNTDAGPVSLETDISTTIRIPGWDTAIVTDIAEGTPTAVLVEGDKAVSILALSLRPVNTRHFTGMVVPSENRETLTLQDNTGKQLTAPVATDVSSLTSQELVTAILRQGLTNGDLTVTAVDRASASARRLFAALELNLPTKDTSDNLSVLRWRLAEHSAGHLSILSALEADSLAAAKALYSPVIDKNLAGGPSANVTGMVTQINSATGQVTVQPDQGSPVTVRIDSTTPVSLSGERVRSGQLDLASHVNIRYELDSGDARQVSVLAGNTLADNVANQLALAAGEGEILGSLVNIGQWGSSVTVRDAVTGRASTLQTTDATILDNGRSTELSSNMEGSTVVARFDPQTLQMLEIEQLHLNAGEELVSGVVHSFIPKSVDGNLTIRTASGELRSFTHKPSSAIRRDGLQISISGVRLGDLVRPNTRVRSLDTTGNRPGEIVLLSLKAPKPGRVTGIIRGVTGEPASEVRVTVSSIWLDLISLKVGPETEITQQGLTVAVRDLTVGQEIVSGSYDPVTLVAGLLKLEPPDVADSASLGR